MPEAQAPASGWRNLGSKFTVSVFIQFVCPTNTCHCGTLEKNGHLEENSLDPSLKE